MKELEFMAKDIYEIIFLDDELRRALNEHRLDDYYSLSVKLCVRATYMANILKAMS